MFSIFGENSWKKTHTNILNCYQDFHPVFVSLAFFPLTRFHFHRRYQPRSTASVTMPATSCSSSSSSTLSSYRSAFSSVASAASGGSGEKNQGDDSVFLPTKGILSCNAHNVKTDTYFMLEKEVKSRLFSYTFLKEQVASRPKTSLLFKCLIKDTSFI